MFYSGKSSVDNLNFRVYSLQIIAGKASKCNLFEHAVSGYEIGVENVAQYYGIGGRCIGRQGV